MSTIATPQAGSVLSVLGDKVTVLIPGDDADGLFETFLYEAERDAGPPPHSHAWIESFYVLHGQVEYSVDGVDCVAGPGHTAVFPADYVHSFRVASDTASFIVTASSDRASRFFADLSANVPHGRPTPDTLPMIIEVAKRNGLSSPIF